jgi:hypothetical protein
VEEEFLGVSYTQIYVGEYSGDEVAGFSGEYSSTFQAGAFSGEFVNAFEGESSEENYAGTYIGESTYGAGGELLGSPAVIETYTLYVRVD